MKFSQLVVIQCCNLEPALRLGKLFDKVEGIDVVYAYDSLCPFKFPDNSIGLPIGAYTKTQGMFNVDIWHKLMSDSRYDHYDYYHLVSHSDLPGVGLLTFGGSNPPDFYGSWFIDNKSGLRKGSAWYGLSNTVAKFINFRYESFKSIAEDVILKYDKYRDSNKVGFTGGYDEYIVGYMFDLLSVHFTYLKDNYRLAHWCSKDRSTSDDGEPVSMYCGLDISDVDSYNTGSPMNLRATKAVKYQLTENTYYLFGRKFVFDSDEYNEMYKLIESKFNQDGQIKI